LEAAIQKFKLGTFVQYMYQRGSYIGNTFSPSDSFVFVDPCGLEALVNSALDFTVFSGAFGVV